MHKFCLTEAECSKIQGAQTIIETLGYFPSMENTVLEEVNIKNTHHNGIQYEVSLLFDLSCKGKHYIKGGKPRIRITFWGVRTIEMNTDIFSWEYCRELTFIDWSYWTKDKKHMGDVPTTYPVFARPFCGCIIGDPGFFYLEIDDGESTVDAFFED